jgi:hypothetical protein
LIKLKHRLWTRYIETRDPEVEKKYKKIRNDVRQKSIDKTREEQKAVANECRLNPKKFWAFVKSRSGTSNAMGDIVVMETNGKKVVITDDEQKSNVFAEYFSSVFSHEPDSVFEEIPMAKLDHEMPVLVITDDVVLFKLSKLKTDKSPGPDLLHPRILQESKSELNKSMANLFRLSLKEGKLPEDWQKSTVTAVFKKGNKSSVSNYRPISLTSIPCKIMESIIRDHIVEHFNRNKLFSNKQFGFIKGRSTVLQMLNVLDKWTVALEEGGCIDAIYTDFEKAFDKVPHKRLLSKLKAYGISEDIVNWIEQFLCFRSHRVKVNGKYSLWHKVLSGIPQGSILGPLLFVIYINDLVELCDDHASIFLFADDAKIFRHIRSNIDQLELQKACNILSTWSEKWLLPLNVSKCILLRIGRNTQDYEYEYRVTSGNTNATLQRVDSIKDLGIVVDENLNFKEHINIKINKAFAMLGIIKRNFKHMESNTLIKLYKKNGEKSLRLCSVYMDTTQQAT